MAVDPQVNDSYVWNHEDQRRSTWKVTGRVIDEATKDVTIHFTCVRGRKDQLGMNYAQLLNHFQQSFERKFWVHTYEVWCPGCERNVPPKDDYLCEECRYGI